MQHPAVVATRGGVASSSFGAPRRAVAAAATAAATPPSAPKQQRAPLSSSSVAASHFRRLSVGSPPPALRSVAASAKPKKTAAQRAAEAALAAVEVSEPTERGTRDRIGEEKKAATTGGLATTSASSSSVHPTAPFSSHQPKKPHPQPQKKKKHPKQGKAAVAPPPSPPPAATASSTAASSNDAEDDDDESPSSISAKSSKASARAGRGTASAAAAAAAQTVPSGVRLENVSLTFKNAQVLKNVSWEVKKGERVGLVGVNGAGKTTQLQLITGALDPDDGVVLRQSPQMRIAYLTQEFDVVPTRTVREEFMSAYADQLDVLRRTEEVQKELEAMGGGGGSGGGESSSSDGTGGVDMARMGDLLDELQELTSAASDLDVSLLDKKVDEMMPELGFGPDDNDRLVASYSGGWQMRMCLGKILLQDPDLLLLDEPTNHLDLGAIEWLETYLRERAGDVPMVVVSHDREFLDRLCTKIVETELGVATTYKGNYSQFVAQKAERAAAQWVAWEKWTKEVSRQRDLVDRLAGGAQSGRAAAAEKELERLSSPGERVEKPFVPKRRAFSFPNADHSGQKVLEIEGLRHGYGGRLLFDDASLEVEKGERVAVLGPNGAGKSTLLRLVMGREQPEAGKCSLGSHNVVANYFEQNQAEALDGRLTVLETLERAAPDAKLMVRKQRKKRGFFFFFPPPRDEVDNREKRGEKNNSPFPLSLSLFFPSKKKRTPT